MSGLCYFYTSTEYGPDSYSYAYNTIYFRYVWSRISQNKSYLSESYSNMCDMFDCNFLMSNAI